MRVLVTNDDGIHAEGLKVLVDVIGEYADQIVVVCPDSEKSACGHGMTLRDPLRVKSIRPEEVSNRHAHKITAYTVNGLPVDCVNVGLSIEFADGCDLVVSGINHGPNLGFDVTYSGTVAGAMEGTINGIFSLSVSIAKFVAEAPEHFETARDWLKENFTMLLKLPRDPLCFLNINIPSIALPEINGYRFSGMGKRVYEDRVEKRLDPWGRPYYWQGGVVVMSHDQPGTDVQAVLDGYVAITPVSLDWTSQALLNKFDCTKK